MPLFDYYCEKCKIIEERIVKSQNESCFCDFCNSEMIRKFPNKTNFKLVYNNKTDTCDWDGNTSQYWDNYKKAKAEGKDVRPINE